MDWLVRLLGLNELPAPGHHILQAQRLLDFATVEGVAFNKE
jgi:hypothetical protein